MGSLVSHAVDLSLYKCASIRHDPHSGVDNLALPTVAMSMRPLTVGFRDRRLCSPIRCGSYLYAASVKVRFPQPVRGCRGSRATLCNCFMKIETSSCVISGRPVRTTGGYIELMLLSSGGRLPVDARHRGFGGVPRGMVTMRARYDGGFCHRVRNRCRGVRGVVPREVSAGCAPDTMAVSVIGCATWRKKAPRSPYTGFLTLGRVAPSLRPPGPAILARSGRPIPRWRVPDTRT